MDPESIRLQVVSMVIGHANAALSHGLQPDAAMMERMMLRMASFVECGAFDPAEQAFVARMTEPVA